MLSNGIHLFGGCHSRYLLENVDINLLRDFRYTLLRSICADALDMFASQTRDLYHIVAVGEAFRLPFFMDDANCKICALVFTFWLFCDIM